MKELKAVGIIPARGGSKGIPGKNKKEINGKPLIKYTLEAASRSRLHEIIVSTDDLDIKEIAVEMGIRVIERPSDISGDDASTHSVLLHAMKIIGRDFDIVMTLQPTSPLRTAKHIDEALMLFQEHPNADSLVSVVKVPHNYLPMSLMKQEGSWIRFYDGQQTLVRRQDKPEFFARNGAAIYITRTDRLFDYIVGGNILPYEMSKIDSIDIDDNHDWHFAEILLMESTRMKSKEK